MVIRLDENYNAMTSTALLGYVGETNARPVSVEGMEIDGADRYVLTIDYGDGVQYEVDITGGQWTPTADILRSAQTVSCQIAAKKLSGQEYVLVKKSRIFRLRIGAAIGDTAIPSPDVSLDALDRIAAIGEQAHADMQTAQTAAETATQAAENAAKSSTAAGVSADTAERAASRAETAQTAAETSATQAENAKQSAETAHQQAVTAQNNAKISADLATTAAQQTAADKTATAGYAQTAKTNADSTAADRQAVQELAAQVTADKATVADNAAKVAADRTAAETAAQTAQAVADSLPDDYTTAVGKIAENTAEIGRVKLTDKELTRRVDALYDMGNGVTHRFETDSETAYAKTVPTGGKLMSVKNVGGRSVVFNQIFISSQLWTAVNNGVSESIDENGIITLNGTSTVGYLNFPDITDRQNRAGKFIFKFEILNNPDSVPLSFGYHNRGLKTETITNGENAVIVTQSQENIALMKGQGVTGFTADTVFNDVKIRVQIFDLTAMFGSGNEPSTVEEFKAMFPNDYYPYCAGEIVSAGTEEVVEQGANQWDEIWENGMIDVNTGLNTLDNAVIRTTNYTPISPNSTYFFKFDSSYTENIKTRFYDFDKKYIGCADKSGNIIYPNKSFIVPANAFYVRFTLQATYGSTYKNDIALIAGSSGDYTPYRRNEYTIPEAIRNLPGYGWSAGTAKNWVDYENKQYHQCVGSMDLGTLTWARDGVSNRWYSYYNLPRYLSDQSAMCGQLSYTANVSNLSNEQWGHSGSGYFEVYGADATTSSDVAKKLSGVILYYKLATPIVTDISDLIDDDFLRNLTVEAGGTITFKGGNDDYRLPVPSELEYIVKLSDVGGTT